jgi:hypothetical protein
MLQCHLRFCNFTYNTNRVGKRRWIDVEQFERALTFCTNAVLLLTASPGLAEMIAMAVTKRMGAAVGTNGWLYPAQLDHGARTAVGDIERVPFCKGEDCRNG